MNFTISDRLALLNVLPMQGNIVTLRVVQELKMSLSFSEEEMEKWKIVNQKVDGGAIVTWDEDFANETKDIEIGKATATVIKQELVRQSNQGKLRFDAVPLYERFVEGKEEAKA